jgi:hypothetical protein
MHPDRQRLATVCSSFHEIGYLPMNREQANLFFQVIAALYEKSSLIVGNHPLVSGTPSRRIRR